LLRGRGIDLSFLLRLSCRRAPRVHGRGRASPTRRGGRAGNGVGGGRVSPFRDCVSFRFYYASISYRTSFLFILISIALHPLPASVHIHIRFRLISFHTYIPHTAHSHTSSFIPHTTPHVFLHSRTSTHYHIYTHSHTTPNSRPETIRPPRPRKDTIRPRT
jgi:hypothetical protein